MYEQNTLHTTNLNSVRRRLKLPALNVDVLALSLAPSAQLDRPLMPIFISTFNSTHVGLSHLPRAFDPIPHDLLRVLMATSASLLIAGF